MAQIPASIINTERGLAVEASRQSSCAQCAKKDSCLSQWQISDSSVHMAVTDQRYKVGDTVTISCDDKTLLHYFSLLFLPALSLMLLASIFSTQLMNVESAVGLLFFQLLLPVGMGALISKWLLAQSAEKLLTQQRISPATD